MPPVEKQPRQMGGRLMKKRRSSRMPEDFEIGPKGEPKRKRNLLIPKLRRRNRSPGHGGDKPEMAGKGAGKEQLCLSLRTTSLCGSKKKRQP